MKVKICKGCKYLKPNNERAGFFCNLHDLYITDDYEFACKDKECKEKVVDVKNEAN